MFQRMELFRDNCFNVCRLIGCSQIRTAFKRGREPGRVHRARRYRPVTLLLISTVRSMLLRTFSCQQSPWGWDVYMPTLRRPDHLPDGSKEPDDGLVGDPSSAVPDSSGWGPLQWAC